MENMEQYIGRKIKGFKFESNISAFYSPRMDDYVGYIGIITSYTGHSFRVKFNNNRSWYYPCKLAIQHLIPTDTKTITKAEATALIESMTGDKYEII